MIGNVKGKIRQAVEWLSGRAKDAAKGRTIYHRTPEIGQLYLFNYSAKHKDTLPYWDRNPLMMPIGFYNDGWLGLNFHYLPPAARKRLFDRLKQFSFGVDDRKRLALSYSLLKSAAADRRFQPCVKRYLYSHVRSRFAYIPPEEWDMAIMLPTQKFAGASAGTVWRNSMR